MCFVAFCCFILFYFKEWGEVGMVNDDYSNFVWNMERCCLKNANYFLFIADLILFGDISAFFLLSHIAANSNLWVKQWKLGVCCLLVVGRVYPEINALHFSFFLEITGALSTLFQMSCSQDLTAVRELLLTSF